MSGISRSLTRPFNKDPSPRSEATAAVPQKRAASKKKSMSRSLTRPTLDDPPARSAASAGTPVKRALAVKAEKHKEAAVKKKISKAPRPLKTKRGLRFEVEAVLKKREGKWGSEYFVKWEGYPDSDNSWIGDLPPLFRKEWK